MEKEFIFEGKKYVSAKRAGLIYGYNPDYVGQLCREGVLDGRIVGRSWFVSDDAIKNHKNQVVQKPRTRGQKNNPEISEIVNSSAPTVPVISYVPTFQLSSIGMVDTPTPHLPASIKVAFAVMIGLIVSVSVAGLSRPGGVDSAATRSQEAVASVGSVAVSVELALRQLYQTLADIVAPRSFSNTAQQNGVVVVPTEPAISDAKRAEVKKRIQESFSDEVRVAPDTDDTSGIVTPVFKNDRDQSYMYVMVPLKE